MFDFVFQLVIEFINTLAWYIPILILTGIVGYLISTTANSRR